jgi:hypothetical protein
VWFLAGVVVGILCLMLCGAGPLGVMGDQMFCAAVDASMTLASLDCVVCTVTHTV